MASVELPSGNTVEYRDQLKAMDRFAVQDAVFLEVKDGVNRAALGFGNDIRNALLGRIIIKWSYPTPIPAQVKDITAADVVIGETMDLDDYNALAEAVQPLVDKVSGVAGRDKKDPKKPSAS
jgi:hypothetical protein